MFSKTFLKKYFLFIVILINSNAFAIEQGQYARSSVSYLDAIWMLDPSVAKLSPDLTQKILREFRSEIALPRFDYNALPDALVSDFRNEANRKLAQLENIKTTSAMNQNSKSLKVPHLQLDEILNIANTTLVPKIQEILNSTQHIRAQALTSEAQRNSFISDKAKSLGYTADEIEKVMNSAWIMLPLASNYSEVSSTDRVVTKMDVGVLWIKMVQKDGQFKAIPITSEMSSSIGFGTRGGLSGSGINQARSAMVANAIRNLTVITKEIAEFKLSAQILEAKSSLATFNLGKKEGLNIDDPFLIMESREDENGQISFVQKGWGLITDVADTSIQSNGKRKSDAYLSQIDIVAGEPVQGDLVVENPRLPIELRFGGQSNTSQIEINNLQNPNTAPLKLKGLFSAGIDAQYNMGKAMGLHQFFIGLGAHFSTYNSASDSIGSYNAIAGNIDFLATKKWSIYKRLSLTTSIGLGIERNTISESYIYSQSSSYLNDQNYDLDRQYAITEGGLELALSPAWKLEMNAQYNFGAKSTLNYLSVSESQPRFGLYFTFNPPHLPFDPLNFLLNF